MLTLMFDTTELSIIVKKIKDYAYIKDQILKCFPNIKLDEESHTYTYNSEKLTSTSKYISAFELKPFNSHNISVGVSRNQNSSVYKYSKDLKIQDFLVKKEDIMIRYKLMGEEAVAKGKRIHSYTELYPFFIKPSCDQEYATLVWFYKYLGTKTNYVYIGSEIKIYDTKTKKAGTIDLLLFNTKTKKLVICDWKSNKSSLVMSYGSDKLAKPFNNLSNCLYVKYSLQLSDYKNILESNTPFEVEDMFIIHLFNEKIDYVNKYKNKSSYVLFNDYILKAKTKHYTMFQALDLSDKLKETYTLWQSR